MGIPVYEHLSCSHSPHPHMGWVPDSPVQQKRLAGNAPGLQVGGRGQCQCEQQQIGSGTEAMHASVAGAVWLAILSCLEMLPAA